MTDSAQVRSEIVEFLRRELIGPDPRPEHAGQNAGDEILRPQDPPRLRYSAAVLFPGGVRVSVADSATTEEAEAGEPDSSGGEEAASAEAGSREDEADASTGWREHEFTEHEVNRANEFLPSAIGLTALLRLPRKLTITVSGGRYEKKIQAGIGRQDRNGDWQPHHWRTRIAPAPLHLDCERLRKPNPLTMEVPVEIGCPDLELALHVYSRPYSYENGKATDHIVTFTLINRTPMSGSSPRDSECLFQSHFSVEAEAPCFLEYPEREELNDDEEEQSLRLLYRHRKVFAVGHGCAAAWPDTEGGSVPRIGTDCLPAYEIMPILPREIPGLVLDMRELSDPGNPTLLEKCRRLADEYASWIISKKAAIESPEFPQELRDIGLKHVALCEACHERIASGIELLSRDGDTRQAFAWTNRAMLLQQIHYDLSANQRRTWKTDGRQLRLERCLEVPDSMLAPRGKGAWRPFQLAFVLMNLGAMTLRPGTKSSTERRFERERETVDLIWFPTGGGKTEAYLGLTAFTIFRRRLFDPNDAGTTALMRYTLRLLTTQQFQRAASLICACELIRRDNELRLGGTRISIGLWVGGDVTPNKNSSATAPLGAVQAHRRLLAEGKPNPFVVLTCPWCGAEMGPVRFGNAYRTPGYRHNGRTVVFRCEDPLCDFRDERGLPLLVIDEEIYAERPTLLIGTVDKFAMLPWYPDSGRLFGLDSATPVSPPDLIIQDEMHLISGALGSMVGMYEGTIHALCTRHHGDDSVPPKIVASTATICRASDQVHSLFGANVFLFPPQGLRAGDSFFAEEADRRVVGPVSGRLYVGVFCSAVASHVTAQIRVMAALLQSVKCTTGCSPAALDPYWTVMAYFNSLRELGHAATLIRADIREHLNAVWDRLNIRKPNSGDPDLRRFVNRDLELTSRIQSSDITNVLQELFTIYSGPQDNRAVDVCLATNMIQVGLDVPRLGLMTVVGQPKTTSEYIQATSRVGRQVQGPGLVVTIYNPAKPRDRSHFEHFRSYHQAIYRWVEPTSVTPFAIPVCERALHAQLVTLARSWGGQSIRNAPSPPPDSALLERIRDILIKRIRMIDSSESPIAEGKLKEIIERWIRLQPPIYGRFGPPPQETPLMYPSGTEPRAIWTGRALATPSSMRNVDAGCDAEVIQQFPTPVRNEDQNAST